jgi:hypothetical protein
MTTEMHSAQSQFGTPGFVAPEFLETDTMTPTAHLDCFALSLTTYFVLDD